MTLLKRGAVALALLASCAVAWAVFHHEKTVAPALAIVTTGDDVSALVVTAPATRQAVANQLTLFGEVSAAHSMTMSLPRPAQLVVLSVIAGQRVAAGDALATLVSDPAAQAAYVQANTALAQAQRELQRQQELLSLQLATQSQQDVARKALQDAQSTLDAQKKLGGGDARVTLVAPFEGVISTVTAAQGERLTAGAPILQIGRLDMLRVVLGVDPGNRMLIKTGQTVKVAAVQTQERTPVHSVIGKVSAIQGQVDVRSGLISVVVMLPGSAAKGAAMLVPGMRVQATTEAAKQDAWVVPRQAVLHDEKGTFLYQVRDHKARRVPVASISEQQDTVRVSGALDPALAVVILGNYELQDGMTVREDKP